MPQDLCTCCLLYLYHYTVMNACILYPLTSLWSSLKAPIFCLGENFSEYVPEALGMALGWTPSDLHSFMQPQSIHPTLSEAVAWQRLLGDIYK